MGFLVGECYVTMQRSCSREQSTALINATVDIAIPLHAVAHSVALDATEAATRSASSIAQRANLIAATIELRQMAPVFAALDHT